MTRPNLLHQRFSIIVRKPDGTNAHDISKDVNNVTLEIDQNRITILTFELQKTEKYAEWLDSSYKIEFYGGYLMSTDYYKTNASDLKEPYTYSQGSTNEHFRYMYKGSVWRMVYDYGDDGTKTLHVESKDFSWGVTAYKKAYFSYPSADSLRAFAKDKTQLKLSEIVKGIAKDIGMSTDVDGVSTIQIHVDTVYTASAPAVQHGETDWAFLRQLAKQNACYVWTNIDPSTGQYTLYFVDRDKAVNQEDKRIEFVWLDRTDEYEFKQGDYLPTGDGKSEFTRLKNNQIQLLTANVEISPTLTGTNITQVTEFNEETGAEETKLVSYTEDSDSIIYYELNRAKVNELVKTNPQEADRISNMGPFGIPPEVFLEYYTPVPMDKGIIKAIDRPFHGIEITAKIIGNVNIEPFQSYRIFGIGKWSTRKSNKALRYYLNGITHTWGDNGFETELRFKG